MFFAHSFVKVHLRTGIKPGEKLDGGSLVRSGCQNMFCAAGTVLVVDLKVNLCDFVLRIGAGATGFVSGLDNKFAAR